MRIGPPKRVIEVDPVEEPVPAFVPDPEEPGPAPETSPEPEGVPAAPEPEKEPAESSSPATSRPAT